MRMAAAWRVGITVITIGLVEAIIFGLAALPVVLAWEWLTTLTSPGTWLWRVAVSMALVPSYALFALCLMVVSPLAMWMTGARSPAAVELSIRSYSWPLLRWVRYMVAIHLVRLFAGTLYRGSPIWTLYLRLDGARLGRRVYINTLFTSDHNLLEIGDDVVIGGGVHLSAHTVEEGIVKIAPVRIGSGVTVGLGSVIDIGADLGAGCQIAAKSFVPKHAKLTPGGVYAGIPVHRIEQPISSGR